MTQTAIPVTPSTIPRYRHWRIQIFAVTWIAYAGFYFTRQAFSVAKLGLENAWKLAIEARQKAVTKLKD